MNTKLRRILASIGLFFMAIFTVSFVIVLIKPQFAHGAFGWLSLVSVLLGVGFFMIVKYVLRPPQKPEYLPDERDAAKEDEASKCESGGAEKDDEKSSDGDARA